MTSISGLLQTLKALPPAGPLGTPQQNEEAAAFGQGKGTAFDAILSGLSQNAPSRQAAAGEPPTNSHKPQAGKSADPSGDGGANGAHHGSPGPSQRLSASEVAGKAAASALATPNQTQGEPPIAATSAQNLAASVGAHQADRPQPKMQASQGTPLSDPAQAKVAAPLAAEALDKGAGATPKEAMGTKGTGAVGKGEAASNRAGQSGAQTHQGTASPAQAPSKMPASPTELQSRVASAPLSMSPEPAGAAQIGEAASAAAAPASGTLAAGSTPSAPASGADAAQAHPAEKQRAAATVSTAALATAPFAAAAAGFVPSAGLRARGAAASAPDGESKARLKAGASGTGAATSARRSVDLGQTSAMATRAADPTLLAAIAASLMPKGTVPTSPTTAPSTSKPRGQTEAASGIASRKARLSPVFALQGRGGVPMPGAVTESAPTNSPLARHAQDGAGGRASAKSVDVKISAVSSATHFAPVARLSPTQQIAGAVVAVMQGAAQPALGVAPAPAAGVEAASLTSSAAAPSQSAPAPVRVLNLQLEPASLGAVSISLNLAAGGLDVRMAADQASTVTLIENDKQSLSDQLRQSGYSVAGLAVTLAAHNGAHVANNGSATQGQNGQAPMSGGGQAMSQGGSFNGNSGARNSAQNSVPGTLAAREPTDGTPGNAPGGSARGPVSGDLYI